MTYLIVGLDPGTSTGLAIIKLNGEVELLKTKKKYEQDEIIRDIKTKGVPIMFATDRKRAPRTVKKMCSKYVAVLFSPQQDLQNKEKSEITSFVKTKSQHEKDALAAALFAYKKHKKTFEKVERKITAGEKDKIKKKLLLGELRNLKESVKQKEQEVKKKSRRSKPRIRKEKGGGEQRGYFFLVQEELKEFEKRIEKIQRKFEDFKLSVFKERKIRALRQDIEKLRKENQEYGETIKKLKKELDKYAKKENVLERVVGEYKKKRR